MSWEYQSGWQLILDGMGMNLFHPMAGGSVNASAYSQIPENKGDVNGVLKTGSHIIDRIVK